MQALIKSLAALTLALQALIPQLQVLNDTPHPLVKGIDKGFSFHEVHGQQLNGTFDDGTYNNIIADVKNILDTRPDSMTINETMEMNDIINSNCPNGFSILNYNSQPTIAQLDQLLDGSCHI